MHPRYPRRREVDRASGSPGVVAAEMKALTLIYLALIALLIGALMYVLYRFD